MVLLAGPGTTSTVAGSDGTAVFTEPRVATVAHEGNGGAQRCHRALCGGLPARREALIPGTTETPGNKRHSVP
jgi:hypothetical protein